MGGGHSWRAPLTPEHLTQAMPTMSATSSTVSTGTCNIGPMIADSARFGLAYAERLLQNVTAEKFARLARVHGETVQSNHPAFICGHLSLYPSRIVEYLGWDASSIAPSEAFQQKFDHNAQCLDDPDGSIYPAMDDVLERFVTSHRMAIEALENADDAVFTAPNPNEPMRAKFATVGAMHSFYLGGHLMLHMGQLSAWRRMMGLGKA